MTPVSFSRTYHARPHKWPDAMLILRSNSGNISFLWLYQAVLTPRFLTVPINHRVTHPGVVLRFTCARPQLELLDAVIVSVIAVSRLCANGHYARVSFRGRRGRGRRSIWRNVDGSSVRRSWQSAGFRGESHAMPSSFRMSRTSRSPPAEKAHWVTLLRSTGSGYAGSPST
jgi:hypothetical protein